MNIDDGRGRGGFSRFPTPARRCPLRNCEITHIARARVIARFHPRRRIFSLSLSLGLFRVEVEERRDLKHLVMTGGGLFVFFYIPGRALSHTA